MLEDLWGDVGHAIKQAETASLKDLDRRLTGKQRDVFTDGLMWAMVRRELLDRGETLVPTHDAE